MSFLETLKQGDKVIVSPFASYKDDRLATVERTTRTQIVVDGVKYRRSDGLLVGREAYFDGSRLKEATDEIIAQLTMKREKEHFINRLKNTNLHRLPHHELKSICEVLDKYL